ncbi:tyrosine-type recombinase/integrase [Providencia rettgeri]|uniref:tyrosine-type recombinase/integrase n=1 Tax=Providencia rettgeri TaxID=587 RepID=UPI001373879C|nr:tyrosine-type recombinase/integrase [Providencia rettgeri]BBV04032.1 integrase [Providencia rettgeri]
MKLNVKQVEAAKAQDKPYKLTDGGGLYLNVSTTGAKSWRLKYRFDKKEKLLTIGLYPSISLSEARKARDKAKDDLANGIDPSDIKKEKKFAKVEDTFAQVFREWFDFKKDTWSEKYRKELLSMFDNDILPIIGKTQVKEADPLELIKVIRHFEDRGAMERASKARRRCGEVYRYAIITGRAKYNPAPDLVDAERGYRKKHYPFLTKEQIPQFNKALRSFSGSIVSKIATQVLQYTALRTKELRSMQWSDVDFETNTISIPEEIMKNGKPHVVPMPNQVVDLMSQMKSLTGDISSFVFAGRSDKRKPISENAVLLVIRQIGFDGIASGHGFRHQFSTILNENGFDRDLIERQLAHVDRNAIRGIYNHAEYLDQRRKMMQWFADYIDEISK